MSFALTILKMLLYMNMARLRIFLFSESKNDSTLFPWLLFYILIVACKIFLFAILLLPTADDPFLYGLQRYEGEFLRFRRRCFVDMIFETIFVAKRYSI